MNKLLKQLICGIAISVACQVIVVLIAFSRVPPSRSTDVSGYYSVDIEVVARIVKEQEVPLLVSAQIQDLYLPLQKDAEAQRFMDTCISESRTARVRASNILMRIGRATIGQWFLYGKSELVGALHAGSLFVASVQQFRKLLEPVVSRSVVSSGQIQVLDIGAGDGSVTMAIANATDLRPASIWAVEASMFKRWRLQNAGFKVTAELPHISSVFDVIVMLNVLDVTDDPAQLLADTVAMLKPGGFLVLSIVLPYRPKLSFGVKTLSGLSQNLNSSNSRDGRLAFEFNFAELLNVLSAYPLTLRKWTRVPYLSSGDYRAAFYIFSEALFLLQRSSNQ